LFYNSDSRYHIPINKHALFHLSKEYVIRLPKPYGTCVLNENNDEILKQVDSVFVRLFKEHNITYSQEECHNYCYQRRLLEVCGCYDTSSPLLKQGKPPCATLVQFSCHMKLYGQFIENELVKNCSDECPSVCTSVSYSYSLSLAEFSTQNYYMVILGKKPNLSWKLFNRSLETLNQELASNQLSYEDVENAFRKRVIIVSFHFDKLAFNRIEESPKMVISDLVSNIGKKNVALLRF
jgi:hypothetical protein